MKKLILMCLVSAFFISCQSQRFTPGQEINSFHIGNSLTWDSQPKGIAEIAQNNGYKASAGYHITCGKPLTYISQNPQDVCVKVVSNFGYWGDALIKNKLDFVTMQPFRGESTLKSEADAIVNFIELCRSSEQNKDTVFYIYATWPPQLNYAKTWTSDFPDEDDAKTVLCAQYFEHIIKRVRNRTDAKVYMIPAGEVLYNLDRELRKGRVPGLPNIQALFRDKVHLSHDLGRFAVALTKYCTIYQQAPDRILKPQKHYGKNKSAFSPEYYHLVYEVVRKVLKNNPHTD